MPSRYERSSSHSKEEDSISPPTYRVVEDELGELFNPDLEVKYPERPKKGRYSLSNYLYYRKKAKKIDRRCCRDDDSVRSEKSKLSKRSKAKSSKPSTGCRCECGRCCCRDICATSSHRREQRRQTKSHTKIPPAISLDALISGHHSPQGSESDNSDFEKYERKRATPKSVTRMKLPPLSPELSLSDLSLSQSYNHDRMAFTEPLRKVVVGPQTAGAVAEMLTPTQFLLYYRRADYISSIDDVPLSEPLTMAYKSTDHKVFHYKICYNLRDGRKFWRIDHGSDSKQHREFTSLERLIQYYKEFQTLSGEAL